MRKVLYIAPLAALVLGGFASEVAGQATATATYQVEAINEVTVSGNPAALVISTAEQMSGVTDNSTTWSVTSNETKKVTGAIDTAMPAGVTLEVNLSAPAGATSAGSTALSATAADLVTGINEVTGLDLGVVYTLKATPDAGVVASATKTVTYTITDAI